MSIAPRNLWLIAGGWLSLGAALLHVGCILGGPAWYRVFGAGEGMARAVERSEWRPAILTIGIAIILAIWAAYAFAGAGVIRRLPLMRTALVAISAVYLLRGLVLVPIAFTPDAQTPFNLWSSAIVLVYGLVYAAGAWLAWPHLSQRKDAYALGS